MRARKKNPYWGQGLDKRQARRERRREGRRWDNHQPGTPDCPALPASGWCDFPGHTEFDLARESPFSEWVQRTSDPHMLNPPPWADPRNDRLADMTPVDPDAHVREGGDVQ